MQRFCSIFSQLPQLFPRLEFKRVKRQWETGETGGKPEGKPGRPRFLPSAGPVSSSSLSKQMSSLWRQDRSGCCS